MKTTKPYLLLFCFGLSSCCICHRDDISPIQRDFVCEDIKQQIILSTSLNAPDQFGKMPNDLALLYRAYDENNCAIKLEKDATGSLY